jgi:hypothetical protein
MPGELMLAVLLPRILAARDPAEGLGIRVKLGIPIKQLLIDNIVYLLYHTGEHRGKRPRQIRARFT